MFPRRRETPKAILCQMGAIGIEAMGPRGSGFDCVDSFFSKGEGLGVESTRVPGGRVVRLPDWV